MAKVKGVVLGSTGMVGRAVLGRLHDLKLAAIGLSRTTRPAFDVLTSDIKGVLAEIDLEDGAFLINCIGLTKSHIKKGGNRSGLSAAIQLNSLFPMRLAEVAEEMGLRVIQVATDCVFSGRSGGYTEISDHDPLDIYGKTKSLGEVQSPAVSILRCSLIGPEGPGRSSLFFEWLRTLEANATIDGFVNHIWNGLTSDAFARVVAGIVRQNLAISGIQHLVPADTVSKFELVEAVLVRLGRDDVRVNSSYQDPSVDRTLKTINSSQNDYLFSLGGFASTPSIGEMLRQLDFDDIGEERFGD